MVVLSCFTPNYPQRKGTLLDFIFVPVKERKKERKRKSSR
jgi:hypothetical protein